MIIKVDDRPTHLTREQIAAQSRWAAARECVDARINPPLGHPPATYAELRDALDTAHLAIERLRLAFAESDDSGSTTSAS